MGARSGVTFDVTIGIPWNAPEAHIQLNSTGVFDLESSIQTLLVSAIGVRLWPGSGLRRAGTIGVFSS